MGPAVVVKPKLEVVLATWNGARFLEQQLHSLETQTLRPDRLLIHDDGSTDSTRRILEKWQQRHPRWIECLPPLQHRLGPTGAFNRLLKNSRGQYIALCDQDDIWHQDRLEIGLAQLQANETSIDHEHQRPLLLHSNANLINSEGELFEQSLWHWHRVNSANQSTLFLSQRNCITGCTILCNRSLLQQALPIPREAIMHDWWLALVASQKKGLIACPKPLLDHRRHESNHSGRCEHRRRNAIAALKYLIKMHNQWQCLVNRTKINRLASMIWWPLLLISGTKTLLNYSAIMPEQKNLL